ncbi:MAG: hypothetical protein VB106_15680 [Clostridiaceae bacterium]|nr:hypothetical protein [Clostridiaceae bacterium]
MKRLKQKAAIIFGTFGLIFIAGCIALSIASIRQLLGVERSEWLNSLFTWISACSAFFLGIIVYLQNERFKLESDLSAQEAKETSEKYNQQLYTINNRLLQLEENKEKAFITFSQRVVQVYNDDDKFSLGEKPYVASFRSDVVVDNAQSLCDGCGVFVFGLVNLTDTPIRSIEIEKLRISYKNWYTDESQEIAFFERGGFIPSPLTTRNKEFLCTFVVPKAKNIAVDLPEKAEIVLSLTVSTESIFGRETRQRFMLRLQKETAYFKAPCPYLFNLYCFESSHND